MSKTGTLEELAATARSLANELYGTTEVPCSNLKDRPARDLVPGRPVTDDAGERKSCLMKEEERPLTRAEKDKGWARRPFYAYHEAHLCNGCLAYWHAERVAQLLHEMNCWRLRAAAKEPGADKA